MCKLIKITWLFIIIPLLANAAYDVNFNYDTSLDYVKDARGDCMGEHFLLADLGGRDQNACEKECDNRKLCTGYAFKNGSCLLKKNISLCSQQDWKTESGYAYYAKPYELDFAISDKISKLNPKIKVDSKNNQIKYCLQVPPDAKEGDKLETTLCSFAQGHKGQTFTLTDMTAQGANPKIYKVKHLESGLCVDLLEFLIDDNPTRLWNCDLSKEPTTRQERQLFKFTSIEIPKGMENYSPFKVVLNTDHDLSLISEYFMMAPGDCEGQDIEALDNQTSDDCASACNVKNECLGFSYSYANKRCALKKIANCTDRKPSQYRFYSKKSALSVP